MTNHSAAPAAPHSADALKPCPFCGGKATYHAGVDCGINVAFAGCDDCKIGSPVVSSLSDAIAAWNRRPTPASPGLDIEALRKRIAAVRADGFDRFSIELPELIALLDRLERAEAALSGFANSENGRLAAAGAVPEGFALVPLDPPLAMAKAFRDADTNGDRFLDGYAAMIAAAPPAQGLPAAPDDPMDWRLPCDVKVGAGTHKKGTTLRSLVSRMEMLHGMAMKAHPVDEAKAAEFRAFLDQQFGSSPPAAAPSEPVAWMRPAAMEPEFTSDAVVAGYWMRKGSTVTPLAPFATPPAQDAGTGAIVAAARKLVEYYPTRLDGMYCEGEPVGRNLIALVANSGRTE